MINQKPKRDWIDLFAKIFAILLFLLGAGFLIGVILLFIFKPVVE